MAKRVLITGFKGFTGQYMSTVLASAGYDVFGLGNSGVAQGNYFVANLLDQSELNSVIKQVKPDYVVHLAAIAFVAHGTPNDFYNVNLIGTRNLLEALAISGAPVKKILVASSANVYGNNASGLLDESTPYNPSNDYSISKIAMEYVCKLWSDKLPIVIARPFNYTGVGQQDNFLIPKIVKHFRELAEVIELGNINVERDFNDVRAVVSAYVGLLEDGEVGEVYNVACGRPLSLMSIIESCQEITGHRIEVTVNPAFVRANEVKVLAGENIKLRSLLPDWQPIAMSDTLHWMLKP
jgi:nucleoside-diphosphate-sugar epimerase